MKVQRTALVTGAAGTMGQALTKMLLETGHRVVATDVNESALHQLSSKEPDSVYTLAFDISNAEAVHAAVQRVRSEFGEIEILINNAGILSNNKSQATTAEEWQRVVAVNLSGMFYMSQKLIPHMVETGWGRIVNVSSLAAKTGGITAGTAYSTSKGGVSSLTFSLAVELAPTGVTVNAVSPAYVNTPMVSEQLTEEERQAVISKIPVGRFCEPEEFAHVVRFLIDDMSGFITGEIIDLNGGLVLD